MTRLRTGTEPPLVLDVMKKSLYRMMLTWEHFRMMFTSLNVWARSWKSKGIIEDLGIKKIENLVAFAVSVDVILSSLMTYFRPLMEDCASHASPNVPRPRTWIFSNLHGRNNQVKVNPSRFFSVS